MYFKGRGEFRSLSRAKYTLVYPKRRPQRPGAGDRCELHTFVLRDEPRVFVGGSEWGFDGLAREADAVEIEALAERFDLPELREVLTRARPTLDEVNPPPRSRPPRERPPRDNPPMQRAGGSGILVFLRRLWAGR